MKSIKEVINENENKNQFEVYLNTKNNSLSYFIKGEGVNSSKDGFKNINDLLKEIYSKNPDSSVIIHGHQKTGEFILKNIG